MSYMVTYTTYLYVRPYWEFTLIGEFTVTTLVVTYTTYGCMCITYTTYWYVVYVTTRVATENSPIRAHIQVCGVCNHVGHLLTLFNVSTISMEE